MTIAKELQEYTRYLISYKLLVLLYIERKNDISQQAILRMHNYTCDGRRRHDGKMDILSESHTQLVN
jgi:hypothetical protein